MENYKLGLWLFYILLGLPFIYIGFIEKDLLLLLIGITEGIFIYLVNHTKIGENNDNINFNKVYT